MGDRVGSPPATDQDSLVGESLVPTDTEGEDETPLSSAQDFQQLIVTNGRSVNGFLGGKQNGHSRNASLRKIPLQSLRENRPLAYALLCASALGLCIFIFIVVVFPNSTLATLPKSQLKFHVPFEKIDRTQFADPASSIIDLDLFDPALLYEGNEPGRIFVFPFPTGAFWTNLVLPPTADQGISYPIAVYPYGYKWSDELLQVSYPAQHRQVSDKEIHDYFFPDLTLATREGSSRRYIRSFDPLSVTLRYLTNSGGYWESYLVQGSPYATIKYAKVSPIIKALSIFKNVICPRDEEGFLDMLGDGSGRRRLKFGVCASTEDTENRKTTLRGIQFILQTQEGAFWMVFASEPITLVFDTSTRRTITSTDVFSGVLRLALIPPIPISSQKTNASSTNGDEDLRVSSSKGLQRLIYHAGVYPVAGDVRFSFRGTDSDSSLVMAAKAVVGASSTAPTRTNRMGTIQFQFQTGSFAPPSSASTQKALLMLALPHHAQSLPSSVQLTSDQFEIEFKCIKGPMQPVLGSTWSYDEPLYSLGFDGDSGSSVDQSYLQPEVRFAIVEAMKVDVKVALPSYVENVYGFGKQVARMAQIAHIASRLLQNETVSTANETYSATIDQDLAELLEESLGVVASSMTRFLSANVSDHLVYDTNFGGLVSIDGLHDTHADFGNGRYNDHHFHYGYILYAAAILGKLDPSFVKKFGDKVDAISFDVTYNSNFDSHAADDVFFPSARHKIWFDGHSFASGLFPFGNGKSQESSSEAVNCYYGAYLWSLVRHGAAADPSSDTSSQTDYARLLLATEIRGAKTYWHMLPPDTAPTSKAMPSVYSARFSKNYMVGNLGMLDAVCRTWFGTQELYVLLINVLPVTAATGELFGKTYATEEYKNVLGPLKEVEMAWKGFVVAIQGILDPQAAWASAKQLSSPTMDSGLSKSQVLYWISTRHGFNAAELASNTTKKASNNTASGSASSSCQSHPRCVSLGLTGDCCPTPGGIKLDCCS